MDIYHLSSEVEQGLGSRILVIGGGSSGGATSNQTNITNLVYMWYNWRKEVSSPQTESKIQISYEVLQCTTTRAPGKIFCLSTVLEYSF